MITGLVVLKIVLIPSNTRFASLANSGPRWSIRGVSIARRMRSGRGVGPGICRKGRPAVREEFWDMLYRPLCRPGPDHAYFPGVGEELALLSSRTNARVSQARSGSWRWAATQVQW